MSDTLPPTPEHEGDPALRRRLAWGLVAGFGLEELARRECVQRSALERVLGQPGIIVLLRVWTTFFEAGDRGDIPLLLQLCKWALAHIRKHARERAVGIGVGYSLLCAFSLQVALKPTLKALCAHIEGLIDLGPPKEPRGVRAKLVEVLCWAIETALMQHLIDGFGDEYLCAADDGFQHAVASGLFGNSLAEYRKNANAAVERDADIPAAEDEPHAVALTAKSELSKLSPGSSTILPWRAPPTRREAPVPVRRSGRRRDRCYERGRCSVPPSVRLRPIGVAA